MTSPHSAHPRSAVTYPFLADCDSRALVMSYAFLYSVLPLAPTALSFAFHLLSYPKFSTHPRGHLPQEPCPDLLKDTALFSNADHSLLYISLPKNCELAEAKGCS